MLVKLSKAINFLDLSNPKSESAGLKFCLEKYTII